MIWFILSLLTAVSESTKDMFSKKGLQKINEYVVAWSLRLFALPFLLPLLFFIDTSHDMIFWYAIVIGGLLNTITSILYMKAIKTSPLSLTVPMLTFTPLFMLITSPIILGEFPGIFGIIGVLLIVLGSYTLNISDRNKGMLAPFRALVKEKGPVLMLIVAFIWSITSNIDKIGVLHSNPLFYGVIVNIFIAIIMFPIMLLKGGKIKGKADIKALLPVGFFYALVFIFQMHAIELALVVYVIAIKRTSAIFSTLYGKFVFGEIRIKERLLGAVIMVIGVLFITLL